MENFFSKAYKVIFDVLYHFSEDDGWAMASHIALSSLLAVFPFLIFGTSLANFLGANEFSATAVHLIFDTWPADIAKPIADQVMEVLNTPRGGLLTISVLAAAYFASNGVEALRIALNRAYRVSETRTWYVTRLQSIGYVLVAVLVFAGISLFLVVVPLGLDHARRFLPQFIDLLDVIFTWRIYGTIFILIVGLLILHLWLPSGKRRVFDVLPGVLVTMLLWLGGALIFAYYLKTFANYTATYAGLASIMVVLVFLYMIAAIFLIGAEINAALLKFRVTFPFRRDFPHETANKILQADEVADAAKSEAQSAKLPDPSVAKGF